MDVLGVLIEAIGWIGGVVLLVAYALVSRGTWDGAGWRYQAANIFGAVALGVNSAWNAAYPSTALNLVWIGLGVWALMRLMRKPQS
jgi:hypothetical protein